MGLFTKETATKQINTNDMMQWSRVQTFNGSVMLDTIQDPKCFTIDEIDQLEKKRTLMKLIRAVHISIVSP